MSTIPSGLPPGLTPAQVSSAESAQWKSFIRQAALDTRCASPGFLVEDMDTTQQTVTVQIAIQERVRTSFGPQWWDVPPIVHVPIIVPRGGGYTMTLPLKKGDKGLLVFCDTCFDNWWLNGTTGSPPVANWQQLGRASSDPSGSQTQFEVRRHCVHDCGFLPGMWTQKDLLSNYATDSMQLRSDDGTTIIDVSESGVAITGAAVTAANGGAVQPLMTDAFYQWFVTDVMPFLSGLGYTGPLPPSNSETTILKGQ